MTNYVKPTNAGNFASLAGPNLSTIDPDPTLSITSDTFGRDGGMTHEKYVALIEERILVRKGLRDLLSHIEIAHLPPSTGRGETMADADRAEELNKLIAEDVALLAEVTSADRI